MKPYTYLIKWSKLGKSYYGVKYAKNANPDTFWKNYFTSSKLVKRYTDKYGDPDVIQIRRTFDTAEEALVWEQKVLRRAKLTIREEFLNLGAMGSSLMNESTKAKISKSMKVNCAKKPFKLTLSDGREWICKTRKDSIAIGFPNWIIDRAQKEPYIFYKTPTLKVPNLERFMSLTYTSL